MQKLKIKVLVPFGSIMFSTDFGVGKSKINLEQWIYIFGGDGVLH